MHPSIHAAQRPKAVAVVFEPSGASLTYRDLDESSCKIAHLLRSLGLGVGDSVALLLENEPAYFSIAWAAQRIGLYYVGISSKLTSAEVAYILKDSQAKALFVSPTLLEIGRTAAAGTAGLSLFTTGEGTAEVPALTDLLASFPSSRPEDEVSGSDMLYSSGTTGRPKGVKPPLSGVPIDAPSRQTDFGTRLYGMDVRTVYLSPAPLYHAAPLRWCMAIMKFGGRVVVMEKFSAEEALRLIEKHRVTHAQWVPTHFVRMLKLPKEVLSAYDLSSLRAVFHAAAPCPIPVKEQMIEWWGPIIHEYYSGTEAFGTTTISAEEWLQRKGSVGRAAIGQVKICDENGEPVGPRTEGVVYFADGPQSTYHNAPEKDAEASNKYGWKTFGDVGWLDDDGYLYLTDRRSFMIVSGGVNVYPQEAENILVAHPKVADAAVIGVPSEDLGEEVKAVIQPVDWADANPDFAGELLDYVRQRLSHVKAPRSIEFLPELPRYPTGKLHKRLLRERYWPARNLSDK